MCVSSSLRSNTGAMVFSTLKLGFLGLAVTEGVRVKMNSTTGWTQGTYTTGYWDCCKPSCSWPGKGHVNHPTLSCDVDGNKLQDGVKAVHELAGEAYNKKCPCVDGKCPCKCRSARHPLPRKQTKIGRPPCAWAPKRLTAV